LSGASGNTDLVPDANISFGGGGALRTVTISNLTDQIGVAPITITAHDNDVNVDKTTAMSFTLMVRPNTNIVLNDFFSYTDGALVDQSFLLWSNHSGALPHIPVVSGQVVLNGNNAEDVNAPLIGAPYTTNSAFVLYSSFKVNFTALPTMVGAYFAHFKDTNSGAATGFGARVFASLTNSSDPSTYFRLGIGNGAGATNTSGQVPKDLVLNSNYLVVTRFSPSSGLATIWIDPTGEGVGGVTATDQTLDPTVVTNTINVVAYALRQNAGEGTMTVDDLKVGLSFASVTGITLPIPLNIQLLGTNVVLTWSDSSFSLQTSTNVLGPYGTVTGTSPYTNPATGSQKYFRLIR
jgi:hypothetical protein